MKKLFLIFLFLTFTNKVYANGKILKSGFITKSASVKEGINIESLEINLYLCIVTNR